MSNNPLNRFHYYPILNPNPNTPLPVCVSPSASPSVSPSASPSASPSSSPQTRAFSVSCPITIDLQEKTDIVITNITNSGIINAALSSYFYIGTPGYSGCASISDLNPYLPDFESSPFLIGIYPAASVSPFTPYPSGGAPCVSDHPCPS